MYVGSAMGSGGLKARVERHLSDNKKVHWHIDHLLMAKGGKEKSKKRGNEGKRVATVRNVYVIPTGEQVECEAAGRLLEQFEVVGRFGSTDCGCSGHLFHSEILKDVQNSILSFSDEIVDYETSELFNLVILPEVL